MDPEDLILETSPSDAVADDERVRPADGRADDALLPALATSAAACSPSTAAAGTARPSEAQIAELQQIVRALPSAAAAGSAEQVATAEAQGMAALVHLLASIRGPALTSRAQAAKVAAELHDAPAAMHLAARQELLHRYRSLITDNSQPSSALRDTSAGDSEEAFRGSMTEAETAMLQGAADPQHVANVMRLLRERQQRRALHEQLVSLRAEQQETRMLEKRQAFSKCAANSKTVQAALARKAKMLKALDQGAESLAQAVATPCDELGVAQALPAADTATLGALTELPGPLYVLAGELQTVQQIYALPMQVEAEASKVRVTVSSAASAKGYKLDFRYHEGMHAVLAKCAAPAKGDSLLQRLYDGDDGTEWPHDANRIMQGGDLPPTMTASQGRPYRWCQFLAGLDRFLAPPAASEEEATEEQWLAWRRQRRAVDIVRDLQRAIA